MRRWLLEAGTVGLALVLALTVWAVAEQASYPEGIVLGVPVVIRSMEDGMALGGAIIASADVQLRAPDQVLQTLRVEDFEAYVDLAGITAGQHQVPVNAVSSRGEVQILGIEPPMIEISLESVAQKTVPVRVELMDSPAFGYDAGTPLTDPPTVVVSGPSRDVENVDVAVVEVYLRAARSTVETRRTVSLRDETGAAVGSVTDWTPRTVTVTVPIEQRPGYRDVPVRVRWEGQPARGYRISEVAVDPSIVTLFGSAAAIQEAPGYVETTPVNLEGVGSNVVERLALIVPENVSVFGAQSVVVSVGITAIEESTWVQRAPMIQGLDERLQVELSPQVVEVLLVGPLPRLETLRPGDVQIVLDLTGLEVGTHTVEPSLILPEGLRTETLVPRTIEVRINWLPTATPTSTPTITPSATATAQSTVTATATATSSPTIPTATFTPATPGT